MCLLFIGWRVNPNYPLLIAANRDEFRARKTAPLAPRESGTILCGLDEEGGGTWLGIRDDLRFCGLTNFRQGSAKRPDALSRGHLVMDLLLAKQPVEKILQKFTEKADQYGPFNILAGDGDRLFFFSSKEKKEEKREKKDKKILTLRPGFYGLSNGALDEPWPKVARGKKLLRKPLLESKPIDNEIVFRCLRDSSQPFDHELPGTGVGMQWERFLAPVFIDGIEYGTRSSALIQVNTKGRIDFFEKTYVHEKGHTSEGGLVHYTLNA